MYGRDELSPRSYSVSIITGFRYPFQIGVPVVSLDEILVVDIRGFWCGWAMKSCGYQSVNEKILTKTASTQSDFVVFIVAEHRL